MVHEARIKKRRDLHFLVEETQVRLGNRFQILKKAEAHHVIKILIVQDRVLADLVNNSI